MESKLTSQEAHNLFSTLNESGKGFSITDKFNTLVTEEITEASLKIVKDHKDGLYECVNSAGHRFLVGGDGSRRNAWAVTITNHK